MNLEIKGVVLIQCLFYNYQKALLEIISNQDTYNKINAWFAVIGYRKII